MIFHAVHLFCCAVKLHGVTTFLLPPKRASLSLCGRCAAYLVDYSFITLYSSVESPGPYNKLAFTLIGWSIGWTIFFVLSLPVRPFLGLVRNTDTPPIDTWCDRVFFPGIFTRWVFQNLGLSTKSSRAPCLHTLFYLVSGVDLLWVSCLRIFRVSDAFFYYYHCSSDSA